LRAVRLAGRNKVFELNGAAIVIDDLVPENVPGPGAGDEKVRGHRNGVIESYDLPVGLTWFANWNEFRVGSRIDVAVGNEVSIGYIGFQGRPHGTFGAAVIEDGHYPLETPLLALRHVLLGCSGGSDVPVDAFEDVIRRVADRFGANEKSFPAGYFSRQKDNQPVLAGNVLILKGFPGRIKAGTQFDAAYLEVAGIERYPVKVQPGGHPQAIRGFDFVVQKTKVDVEMFQAYGKFAEVLAKVSVFFVRQVSSSSKVSRTENSGVRANGR